MKLLTNIAPRSDGAVIFAKPAGATPAARITFSLDLQSGNLVADVADDDVIAWLLGTGNCEPADEADFERADALLPKREAEDADEDEDEGFSESPNGGLPVEAMTPPANNKRKSGAKRAAA